MNTRETERTFSNENLNRQRTDISDGVDRVATAAGETYNQAKNFVDEKVQSVKKTVDNAATEAGSTISKLADKTRSSVNEGYEAGKQYLQDQHFEKLVDDACGVIKKYPVQSLLAGIGMGIFIGNALSRK